MFLATAVTKSHSFSNLSHCIKYEDVLLCEIWYKQCLLCSNLGIDSDDMKLELNGKRDLWKEWATFLRRRALSGRAVSNWRQIAWPVKSILNKERHSLSTSTDCMIIHDPWNVSGLGWPASGNKMWQSIIIKDNVKALHVKDQRDEKNRRWSSALLTAHRVALKRWNLESFKALCHQKPSTFEF